MMLDTFTRFHARIIVEAVSAALDINELDIMSDYRAEPTVRARHACWWIARKLALGTFPQIATQYGRDHSAIMHGVTRTEERRQQDPDFAATLDATAETISSILKADFFGLQRLMHQGEQIDAIATAQRIARGNPIRNAARASTLEVAAMAHRLLALDEVAAMAFQLLCRVDAFVSLDPLPGNITDIERKRDLRASIHALTETLSSAFSVLGYSQEEEINDDTNELATAG